MDFPISFVFHFRGIIFFERNIYFSTLPPRRVISRAAIFLIPSPPGEDISLAAIFLYPPPRRSYEPRCLVEQGVYFF